MAVKKVIQAGDPRLRNKNKAITDYKSPALKKLIKNLKDSMHNADLIGIAGPQIAENYMLFTTHPRNTKSRKLGKTDKLRVYINPKIIYKSKKENIIYEGCGSLENIFGPVSRPYEIGVEALDENGNRFKLKCDGILARVIQHEYDHLMGFEFIQKVNDYGKIITEEHYRKNIRNSKQQKQNSLITRVKYKRL